MKYTPRRPYVSLNPPTTRNSLVLGLVFSVEALLQCHQPKLQPCPRQAPRSSQPPWPSGDDQASAAQSGGLTGLAVM
ncbi:hypothetical protein IPC1338_29990 [Pseudomonas aeruginosa]|nr:hypothetical protein IPC1338_29990 [Pseudomonas aeruginosa]